MVRGVRLALDAEDRVRRPGIVCEGFEESHNARADLQILRSPSPDFLYQGRGLFIPEGKNQDWVSGEARPWKWHVVG